MEHLQPRLVLLRSPFFLAPSLLSFLFLLFFYLLSMVHLCLFETGSLHVAQAGLTLLLVLPLPLSAGLQVCTPQSWLESAFQQEIWSNVWEPPLV